MTTTDTKAEIGRPIPEFDGVRDVWPRGDRLEAIRSAALAFRERFEGESGKYGGARSTPAARHDHDWSTSFGGNGFDATGELIEPLIVEVALVSFLRHSLVGGEVFPVVVVWDGGRSILPERHEGNHHGQHEQRQQSESTLGPPGCSNR